MKITNNYPQYQSQVNAKPINKTAATFAQAITQAYAQKNIAPTTQNGQTQNRGITIAGEGCVSYPVSIIVKMRDEDTIAYGGYGTGRGDGGSYLIKYAEQSAPDNPVMLAEVYEDNGNKYDKLIYINEIDPRNATQMEMKALEAYLGINEKYKTGGFSTLPYTVSGYGSGGLDWRCDYFAEYREVIRQQNVLGNREGARISTQIMQEYYNFCYSKK